MPSRPVPVLFVAACLALSGLVMRRQIAAHPRPPAERPAVFQPGDPGRGFGPPSFPPELTGQPVDGRSWRVWTGGKRAGVVTPIRGQLAAFVRGDAAEAMRYQRRGPFRRFSPDEFLGRVRDQAPEFTLCRLAHFGAVWADPSGQHADVRVTVRTGDGRAASGLYEMVRQDGVYRVAGFRGGGWMPK